MAVGGMARVPRGWLGLAGRGEARHGVARVQCTHNEENRMRKYQVTITGSTPLLMHWDNIEWADEMKA